MLPKNYCFKKILVVFSFFEIFCTRVGNSERFGQGFLHSDSDVRYFGEDVPGVSQSFSEDQTFSYQDEEGTITVLGSPIKFDPPNLNFKEQPIGVPGLRKVTIHNINGHSSIQMLSISGNTIHFHCSFFDDKVIPPGGNTTFDVVFLGREAGVVENTLYIHTSAGSFRYNVEGAGTPNPYRIKPLTGVKLPLNSSYSPVIEIHNPHPSTIQVLEMYSSGGDLHLELPSGGNEADTALWQIPPYHTKQVMRANFLARAENNHTAYIRIKTNTTGAEFLYLPLEVEVSSQPGIYCPQERLDFGLVPSDSGPKTMELLVLNSGTRPITVSSVVATPVTEALNIEFSSVKVLADTLHPSVVSSITFDPTLVTSDGVHSGKLLIKSNNSKYKVTIPWTANVLKGGLHWNATASKFLLTDNPNPDDPSQTNIISTKRPLKITNKFAVPVVVYSVKMAAEAEKFFEMGPFKPTVIKAGESIDLVNLGVKKEAWEGSRHMDSYLTLDTNLTSVRVPLIAFDGKLKPFNPSSPSESVLDFGTIGMNEKRDMYFALLNKGPVKVVLRGWGGNITGSLVELMGVAMGNETTVASRENFTDLARRLYVMPGHFVVYRIGLTSGADEGEFHASVFVSTEYEEHQVPFRFRVAKGSLSTQAHQLSFDTAFPGKISELKLHVHSSFKHKMRVKSLSVVGGDPRFTFDVDDGGKITPGQKSFVGKVTFDPGATCQETEDCYTGFLPEGKFGHPWYLGLALPLNLGDMDLAVVHSLWSRMRAAAYPNSMFNVTLRLDTSEVRGFLFSARAALSWPVLSNVPSLKFPLTQLGNSSRHEVVIANPSSKPLLVHLVPMSAYPNAQNVLNLLPNRIKLSTGNDGMVENEDVSLFVIESVTDADDPFTPLETFGEGFSDKFGVDISPTTFPILLRPNQSAKVTIVFTPTEPAGLRSSVLFVRNNLTGVDVVDLVGSGATGDIKFGNRRAGSIIHAFEVTEKHLKDCDKTVTKQHSLPNLTVKRPFTARNTGQVPLWVTGFDIDEKPCEGFGFKVLDCEPFLLAANDSKKINIAFTPDFTLSRVTRTLTLKTSLGGRPGQGNVKYALAATVPSHLLSVCSRALPRPSWEIFVYYGAISLLTISLCCVMIAAFVEADRILKFCFLLASPSQQNYIPENCKPFDLKEVARSVVLESEKRIAEQTSADSPRIKSPVRQTLSLISSTSNSGVEILKKVDKDSLTFLPTNQDLKNNTQSTATGGNVSFLWKLGGFARFLFRVVIPYPSADTPLSTETVQNSEPLIPEKQEEPKKKQEQQILNPAPTKKSKSKKTANKPKLTSQNSVNDEMETSSTTTESSNPEELSEPFAKGIQLLNIAGSDLSPSVPDQSKKKKKAKAKAEDQNKENKGNKTKKLLEKQDSKQDHKNDKPKLSPKSSNENPKLCHQQSVTPPPQIKPKQQANVKGVPKDTTELRRQQSVPTYDRPPRLQSHSNNPLPVRTESYSGQGNVPGQPLDGFPTVTVMQKSDRPDPPRAIILPELKQNPGSQFGPIGCKVPNSAPTKSTWNDSPAAPNPLNPGSRMLQASNQPHSPPSLIPPPGLTIMQQLQAERRQREEDYVRRQNNWPGFGDTQPSGIPSNNYVESLWDTPNNQGNQGLWGTIGNVWPSTVFNAGFNYPENNETAEKENENLGFDSLSLSSIWSSPGSQNEGENSSWSSLFNNSKKEM